MTQQIQTGEFFQEGGKTVTCSGVSYKGGEVLRVYWYSYVYENGHATPVDMGECSGVEWLARKEAA
jgi:hypothetical protein